MDIRSLVCDAADTLKIEFIPDEGVPEVLKEGVKVLGGEVIDSSVMSVAALQDYLEKEMQDAKEKDLLFSLHLKATMMKVSASSTIVSYCI